MGGVLHRERMEALDGDHGPRLDVFAAVEKLMDFVRIRYVTAALIFK